MPESDCICHRYVVKPNCPVHGEQGERHDTWRGADGTEYVLASRLRAAEKNVETARRARDNAEQSFQKSEARLREVEGELARLREVPMYGPEGRWKELREQLAEAQAERDDALFGHDHDKELVDKAWEWAHQVYREQYDRAESAEQQIEELKAEIARLKGEA